MNASLIEHIVQARGIESQYLDASGQEKIVSPEVIKQILTAMGYPVNDQDALIGVVEQETETSWFTIVEPASIVRQGQDNVLHFKLPIDFANDELDLTISKDNQICKKIKFVPIDQELLGHFEVRDMEIQHYALPVELDLPIGYYQLELFEPGIAEPLGSGTLIITPESCYKHSVLESITCLEQNTDTAVNHSFMLATTKSNAVANINKDLYCTDVRIGQSSNELESALDLVPMDPIKLYQQAYQPIIDAFRSRMSNGAVNIGDIMALLKLLWIPKGKAVNEGAYVYYPFDDLLAILTLESQLNQTVVVRNESTDMPQDIAEYLQFIGMHVVNP